MMELRLDNWVPVNVPNSKKGTYVVVRSKMHRGILAFKYAPLVVEVVDTYFPELSGLTIYLYATYSALGRYHVNAYPYNLALNPVDLKREPNEYVVHVIAHELTHLIQYNYDIFVSLGQEYFPLLYAKRIPKGEEACDLYTYARHPDLVVPGRGGYIGIPENADPEEVHELALEAIRLRNEEGVRNYIKWFKERLKEVV
ncbi:hypothetical protein [Pyrococcus kukulkanii]|uniref:hypothetical protein n=1 Tax=Pyrococcus kukulkanii TaxID=1609559 RepID=UPI00356769BC